MEGVPLAVIMDPLGKTSDMASILHWKSVETSGNNQLFIRIPDVVELKVQFGDEELSKQRISVYPVRGPDPRPLNKPDEIALSITS